MINKGVFRVNDFFAVEITTKNNIPNEIYFKILKVTTGEYFAYEHPIPTSSPLEYLSTFLPTAKIEQKDDIIIINNPAMFINIELYKELLAKAQPPLFFVDLPNLVGIEINNNNNCINNTHGGPEDENELKQQISQINSNFIQMQNTFTQQIAQMNENFQLQIKSINKQVNQMMSSMNEKLELSITQNNFQSLEISKQIEKISSNSSLLSPSNNVNESSSSIIQLSENLSWNSEKFSTNLEMSEENQKITKIKGGWGWNAAAKSLQPTNFFTVRLVVPQSGYFLVGFTPKRFFNVNSSNYAYSGWYLAIWDGNLWSQNGDQGRVYFNQNLLTMTRGNSPLEISAMVDKLEGTIRFWVNGKGRKIAYRNVPNVPLFAAVELLEQNSSVLFVNN